MLQQNDIIKGEITGLAFGGQGIIRQEGLVIFVPFTAPGDHVSCRIVQVKSSFATAQLLEILQPGALRTEPRCPYFGTCGGCQLQHLQYPAQVEHKTQCITDAFQRIGKLPVTQIAHCVPAKEQWAYRRHVTLNLQRAENGLQAGYLATDNRTLLPVNQCPIFVDEQDAVIKSLQELVSTLNGNNFENGRVSIFKQNQTGKYVLHFQFRQNPKNCEEQFAKAVKQSRWSGILVSSPRKTLSFGNIQLTCEIEGLIFSFSPRAFIQNHPEQSLNIYKTICRIASQLDAQSVLDLYCGIGISSLLIAKLGAIVEGVELNRTAIQLAQENAASNGIQNVQFVAADAKEFLKKQPKKPIDLVIVNPPRAGLEKEVVESLIQHAPKHIIYISCMPSTMARDLNLFCREQYRIIETTPFDMFPQTGHVETVVHLTKAGF